MNVRERVINKLFQEAIEHNLIPDGDFSKFKSLFSKCKIEEINTNASPNGTLLIPYSFKNNSKFTITPNPMILLSYGAVYDNVVDLMSSYSSEMYLNLLDEIFHTIMNIFPYISTQQNIFDLNEYKVLYSRSSTKSYGTPLKIKNEFNNLLLFNCIPNYPFKIIDSFNTVNRPFGSKYNYTVDSSINLNSRQRTLHKNWEKLYFIKRNSIDLMLNYWKKGDNDSLFEVILMTIPLFLYQS